MHVQLILLQKYNLRDVGKRLEIVKKMILVT